jgi:two-component system sensor histidine kinase/response regulator
VAIAILTRLGYRADVADNGQLAVELVAQRGYGLVLMDCQLPVLDGYQATIEIRRHEGTAAHAPIVAMTGAVLEDRRRCLAAGMDDHIANPCSWSKSGTCWRVGSRVGMPPMRRPGQRLPPASTGEVLDQRRLAELGRLDTTGNGPALVARLLEGFLAWIPIDLADLRAAIDHGDAAQALRVTHRLKGAAATVGSSGMVSLCEQLELRVRGRALSPATDVLALLEQEFNRVIRALDAIVPKR